MVNGAGGEIGEYLATSKRSPKWRLPAQRKWANKLCNTHAKHYSGNPGAGRQVAKYLLADVMDEEDAFFDKALEGFALSPLTRAKFAPVQAVL